VVLCPVLVFTVLILWPVPAFEQDQDGTEFHPGPARKLSTNLYEIYQCRVYSE